MSFIIRSRQARPLRTAAVVLSLTVLAAAQTSSAPAASPDEVQALRDEVRQLREAVAALQKQVNANAAGAPSGNAAPANTANTISTENAAQEQANKNQAVAATATPSPESKWGLPEGTTVNFLFDGYYGYNFNQPYNRVNLLRAFDVNSNAFTLSQATAILERAPDLDANRRWGARVDLQFGQATNTLQGNPANELRPFTYQNVFQAYGTYVFPIGSGLTVDFGKFASSLGIETNYARDQINYSRAYLFNFLPFYHMGVRTSYKFSDQFSVQYWAVNGTQQTEPFNGFKDEFFGLAITPKKSITWNVNYYLGQEHPDVLQNASTTPITGSQPGLPTLPVIPAPNGRLHIFDSYVTWTATPKLTLAAEGDYVIERLWRDAAPGESSAPSHVSAGAAYLRYQLTPRDAIGLRTEYLSDRGGLFSGTTQALKEDTVTYEFKLAEGFVLRPEYRRDYSNRPYFLTHRVGQLKSDQNTATIGLLWWWGKKEGSW